MVDPIEVLRRPQVICRLLSTVSILAPYGRISDRNKYILVDVNGVILAISYSTLVHLKSASLYAASKGLNEFFEKLVIFKRYC